MERGRLFVMLRSIVGSSVPSLKKELETVRVAQKLLDAPAIGRGECPGRGWCWRGTKKSNMPPCHPKKFMKALTKQAVSRTF